MKSMTVKQLAKELNREVGTLTYWLRKYNEKTDAGDRAFGTHTELSADEIAHIREIEPHKVRKNRNKKKKKAKTKSIKITKSIRDAIRYLVDCGEYKNYEKMAHSWEMQVGQVHKYLNGNNKYMRKETWEKMRIDIEDAKDSIKENLEHASEMEVGIYNSDYVTILNSCVVLTTRIIASMARLIEVHGGCKNLSVRWDVGDDSIYKWVEGKTLSVSKKTWEKIGQDIIDELSTVSTWRDTSPELEVVNNSDGYDIDLELTNKQVEFLKLINMDPDKFVERAVKRYMKVLEKRMAKKYEQWKNA